MTCIFSFSIIFATLNVIITKQLLLIEIEWQNRQQLDKPWRFRFASTTCKYQTWTASLTSMKVIELLKQNPASNWKLTGKVTLKSSANGLQIALNRKKCAHTKRQASKQPLPMGRNWWFRVAYEHLIFRTDFNETLRRVTLLLCCYSEINDN